MSPEPSALEMVRHLHEAVFGDSWARPESPEVVWDKLLAIVRRQCSQRNGLWSSEPFTPNEHAALAPPADESENAKSDRVVPSGKPEK